MSPRLGPSGPRIGRVGLGSMRWGLAGNSSREELVSLLRAAVDAGIHLLDTADVYGPPEAAVGECERWIGSAIRDLSDARKDLVVATKGGLVRGRSGFEIDASPRHLEMACEKSLEALGLETIDLYQLHAPDPSVPLEESVGALVRLRESGKIRFIGLSNISLPQLEIALGITEIATVQNRLGAGHFAPLREGWIEECERRQLIFLAHTPLGSPTSSPLIKANPTLGEVGRSRGLSPAQVLLAWYHSRSDNLVPLPGASRVATARACGAAGQARLSEPERKRVESLFGV